MEKKKALRLAAGGGIGLVALAAAAFALAPGHGGRLIALDLDRDGQIVNAEIQQSARQRFAALDSNGDGRLTGDEWPRGRHGRGRHVRGHQNARDPADRVTPAGSAADGAATAPTTTPTAAQAAPMRRGWAAADVNNDGAIDLREFYARHAARLARADTNGDGTISAEELAAHRPHRGRRGS